MGIATLHPSYSPTSSLKSNGHGNCVTPDNETCHDRFPLPIPLPAGEGDRVSLREFHVKNRSSCHRDHRAHREKREKCIVSSAPFR